MKGWSVSAGYWVMIATGVFLALPMPLIVLASLNPGTLLEFPPTGVSFHWYDELLRSSAWREAALTSIIVGVTASAVATTTATLLAISAWLRGGRWRQGMTALTLAVLVLPHAVFAVGVFLVLARAGMLGTRLGLGLAHGLLALPIVFFTVLAALDSFDRRLIQAAEVSGASTAMAWRSILMPHLGPVVVAAAVFVFIFSFDEPVVSFLVGRGTAVTVPNMIWRSIGDNVSPIVGAVAVVVALVGIGLQLVALVWLARKSRAKASATITSLVSTAPREQT